MVGDAGRLQDVGRVDGWRGFVRGRLALGRSEVAAAAVVSIIAVRNKSAV